MDKYMEFYAYISETEEGKAKLAALSEKMAGTEDKEQLVAALVALAREEGYEFTVEDTMRYLESFDKEGSLSDEELEAVAGGKSGAGACIVIGGFTRE